MKYVQRSTAAGLLLALLTSTMGCATARGDLNDWRDNWGKDIKSTPRSRAMTHYLVAVMEERSGRLEEAAASLAEAVDLEPESRLLNVKLIQSYVRQQAFEEALSACKDASDRFPAEPALLLVQGEIQHRLGHHKAAIASFQKAIELDPENTRGYSALADLQESVNDLVAAVDICEKLVEMNPDSALLRFQLALNLIRMGDNKAAEAQLNKVLELNPKMVRARWLLGSICVEEGRLEESIAHLQFYVRARPGDLVAAESLAGALSRLGRHTEATRLFSGTLFRDDASPRQRAEAIYGFLLGGRPDTVINLRPHDETPILGAFMKVLAYQQAGEDPTHVLDDFAKAEGELDVECDAVLSGLLYRFGQEDTGERLLGNIEGLLAAGAGPAEARLRFIQGRLLLLMDSHEEAIDVFTSLAAAAEDDPLPHYYLALAHDALDNFAATEAHLQAYLALRPDDAEVLNFLGYLYAEKDVKLDEAGRLLDRALAIDPGNPYYLDSLGWVYYRKGKAEKAIELIQRAIYAMDSDDAELRDHLGDAYLLKGDTKRAVAEWERARRLDPALEGVAEKLEKHGADR